MCLRPITIYNKSKVYSLNGGQPMKIQVPCGCCAECLKAKRDEWLFRSYYQALDTFSKGGYVLFDTLTYAPKNLPHVSDFCDIEKGSDLDFTCFSVEDYRLFFVRLRRALTYHGFDVVNNLRYFLVSEYGEDERYTHAPHYHVLFYVTDNSLDPLVLSQYINRCWQKGRTDGIDYHDSMYVLKHVYRRDGVDAEGNNGLRIVSNYVSKYVTKDSNFLKVVGQRFRKICKLLYCNSDISDEILLEANKKNIDQLKRAIFPFHRQSQGFGIYGLTYNKFEDIYDTGMITMPAFDKKSVAKHIPIPTYYKFKLFYDLKIRPDGTKTWIPNEVGRSFKCDRIPMATKTLTKQFQVWYDNLSNYMTDNPKDQFFGQLYVQSSKNYIDWCLDGRSFEDLAKYCLYYRGRILPRKYYDLQELPDIYSMVDMSCDDPFNSDVKVNNYISEAKCLIKNGELDDYYADPSSVDFALGFGVHLIKKYGKYDVNKFEDFFVIDQDYHPDFYRFDDLLDKYQFMCWFKNKKKQDAFDFEEELKYKLKNYRDHGSSLSVAL